MNPTEQICTGWTKKKALDIQCMAVLADMNDNTIYTDISVRFPTISYRNMPIPAPVPMSTPTPSPKAQHRRIAAVLLSRSYISRFAEHLLSFNYTIGVNGGINMITNMV